MSEDADRAALAEAASTILAEHENGEAALEAVLEVDTETDTWTFDDIPLDSGTFGELVSKGIVESVDNEYRATDLEIIRAVLEDRDVSATSDSTAEGGMTEGLSFDLGTRFDVRTLAGLAGVLFVLFVLRITSYRSVFQGEHVVLPANDPYHYRYWNEQLITESNGLADVSVLTRIPEVTSNRPFTYTANWFFVELLGGDQWAADMVAAWFPVVSSLAVGVLVFWLAVIVTEDVRVGLTSVLLLAFAPIHAVYSGLGFLEHRPHQYFWMSVTLVTLAWLAVDLQRRLDDDPAAAVNSHLRQPWTWVAAFVLGISLTFSAHAWSGSILIFGPIAGYVALKAVLDLRTGLSPARANLPLVGGLGLGGVLATGLHVGLGWHETFMASVPLLVCAGAIALIGLGEVWQRMELAPRLLVGVEAVLGVVALVVFRFAVPGQWERLLDRADALLFREGATETVSLFASEYFVLMGPTAQVGIWFFIALGVLGWAGLVASKRYEPAWLLLSVYGFYWMVLATMQVRFAAQMTIPLAVFGGLGFVYLLSWIDLVRVPMLFRNDSRQALTADGGERPGPAIALPESWPVGVYILGVALLVLSVNFVFLPTFVETSTHSEDQLEAALVMNEHAEEVGWEWRDNAVFSVFGDNRMYNYFVSGESESYPYVGGWYPDLVQSEDPDKLYGRIEDRFGYVVADSNRALPPDRLGSNGNVTVEHYQLLWLNDDGDFGTYAIVEGATIEGVAEPNTKLTIKTRVNITGEAFTYEQSISTGDDGAYAVTVPYPGEYSVDNNRVIITEDDVLNGEIVTTQ